MGRTIKALLALVLASGAPFAFAQSNAGCMQDRSGNVACGPAGSQCLQDLRGDVKCSPPKGGILLDRYRNAVCGAGACAPNRHGDVVCSSAAEGSIAFNMSGDAVCTSGCVAASAQLCVTPKP